MSKSRSQLSSSIHPTKLSRLPSAPPREAAHRHQLLDDADPSAACSPSHSGSGSTLVRSARNCWKQSASVATLHCAATCCCTAKNTAASRAQPLGGGAPRSSPIAVVRGAAAWCQSTEPIQYPGVPRWWRCRLQRRSAAVRGYDGTTVRHPQSTQLRHGE